MSDDQKQMDNALSFLLGSGAIGIDAKRFILDQTSINSAMLQTNRILLCRILSKLEKVSPDQLLEESSVMDELNLVALIDGAEKFAF